MWAVSRQPGAHPASSLGPRTSEVSNVESGAQDVVEVPIDSDMTGEKVAVCGFDANNYTREKVFFTVLEIKDVRYPLCAVSQTHGDK